MRSRFFRLWRCTCMELLRMYSLEPTSCLQPLNGESDPVTIVGVCDPVCDSPHRRWRIAHCNAESDQAEQSYVILPIANGHHVGWRDAKLVPQGRECRCFIHTLMGDLQVVSK